MMTNLRIIGTVCIISIVYSFIAIQTLSNIEYEEYFLSNSLKATEADVARFRVSVSTVDSQQVREDIPFLLIGIPTFPRNGVEYLDQSLARLASELEYIKDTPWYDRIQVLVMNNAPGKHPLFAKMKEKYSKDDHFVFVENTNAPADDGMVPRGDEKTRQCLHFGDLLHFCSEKSSYYLFYEDDFLVCPNSLNIIFYLITKANRYFPDDWISLRFSYGLNGYVMRGDDISALGTYVRKHYKRRPVDHLTVEWMAGETEESREYIKGRKLLAFHTNLLYHIGVNSSMNKQPMVNYPKCFAFIGHPTNFKVEAFDPLMCPKDDLWPCVEHNSTEEYFYIPIRSDAL